MVQTTPLSGPIPPEQDTFPWRERLAGPMPLEQEAAPSPGWPEAMEPWQQAWYEECLRVVGASLRPEGA